MALSRIPDDLSFGRTHSKTIKATEGIIGYRTINIAKNMGKGYLILLCNYDYTTWLHTFSNLGIQK